MSISYAVGQRLTATLLQTLADYTVNKPLCRLIQQAGQSFTDNTDTAITFGSGSDDVDTHNFHDESTNNSRITPTVAGYYTFTGLFYVPAATDYATLQILLKKNGGTNLPSRIQVGPNATSSARSIQVVVDNVLANGSTDYFELWATQDNTGSASRTTPSSGGSTSCLFTCAFQRPS